MPKAALSSPDNAEVLAWSNTDAVFARFTVKILEDESAKAGKLTPECFKQLVNEVKAETGAKGKELFHPIRIVITGSHSGPEFDKLIPILEEGSRLNLPRHVLSVRERVEEFARRASTRLERRDPAESRKKSGFARFSKPVQDEDGSCAGCGRLGRSEQRLYRAAALCFQLAPRLAETVTRRAIVLS